MNVWHSWKSIAFSPGGVVRPCIFHGVLHAAWRWSPASSMANGRSCARLGTAVIAWYRSQMTEFDIVLTKIPSYHQWNLRSSQPESVTLPFQSFDYFRPCMGLTLGCSYGSAYCGARASPTLPCRPRVLRICGRPRFGGRRARPRHTKNSSSWWKHKQFRCLPLFKGRFQP